MRRFMSITPQANSCSERMVFPIWKGQHSLNLMLPKEDRKAMLLRIYNDETPLTDTSKDRFKTHAEAAPDPADTVMDDQEQNLPAADTPDGSAEVGGSGDEKDGGVALTEGEIVGELAQ